MPALKNSVFTCFSVPPAWEWQLSRKWQGVIYSFTYTDNALFYGGILYRIKIRDYLFKEHFRSNKLRTGSGMSMSAAWKKNLASQPVCSCNMRYHPDLW